VFPKSALFVTGAALLIGTTASADSVSRRTPVVKAVESVRDAVVSIAATQYVTVVHRSPHGFDSMFEEMFNLPSQKRTAKRTSAGSGFVIHRDGYIVTNAHVVRRTAERKVVFADGRQLDAKIVAIDTEHDLAVLAVSSPTPLDAIQLGRSDDLMIGETVIAVGNPLGYQNTVTTGVVSALNRELEFSNEVAYGGLIQTDASINPGNSGGPLLNINGELIGINTAIRGDAQNIGFAIPVDHLRKLLPEMLDLERLKRAYLGMRVAGGNQARVTELTDDGPAEQAGIRIDDRILAVDGVKTPRDIDVHFELLSKRPAQTVTFALGRDGSKRTVRVSIAEVPKIPVDKLAMQKFGLEFKDLTPAVAERLGLRPVEAVYVSGVERNGPGNRIGIVPGDILDSLARVQVHKLDEVGQVLSQIKADHVVEISIHRVSRRGVERQWGSMVSR